MIKISLQTRCLPFAAGAALALALTFGTGQALASDGDHLNACADLPGHAEIRAKLQAVVSSGNNGGLSNDMWISIVDRDGVVCAVAFSGDYRGDQWPGSRVESVQKANAANAFDLSSVLGPAASTVNPGTSQPIGGPLFGLQFSNPVDVSKAYAGNPQDFGTQNDPMVGEYVGGINVFGGGLPLYDAEGNIVGGLGIGGDTPCSIHIVAWRVRDALQLDHVPGGLGATGVDDRNFAIDRATANFVLPNCGSREADIIATLPIAHPIGPNW